MSHAFDRGAFKKHGFTEDEIDSIQRGIADIDNGNCISHQEVFAGLRSKREKYLLTNV